MSKLGFGEYELESVDDNPSNINARNIFLKCVEIHVPKVIESLGDEPFKLFLKTKLYYESDQERAADNSAAKRFDWTRNKRLSWWDIEVGNPFSTAQKEMLFDKDKQLRDFVESVFKWSKNNNLDEFWCREYAYETLDLWSQSESNYEEKHWNINIALPNILEPGIKFTYEMFLHYPVYGFREEVRREQIALFNKWLIDVLNECESNAVENGLVKTTQHRDDFDHFKWLAMYQCTPASTAAIAKTVYKSRKAVEDGVTKAAKICELMLRKPLESGRKRKE